MRGRQCDGVDSSALQLTHVETVLIDRDWDRLEPGLHDCLRYRPPARVLDGDSGSATLPQRLPDDRHAWRRPGGDEHPLRLGDDCAHAPEILGQRHAQLTQTAARSVRQSRIGQFAQNGRHRRLPLATREVGHVGDAAAEVVPDSGHRPGRRARRRRLLRKPIGDPRPISGARHEVTLGDQLRVRLDDDAPRHLELIGEQAARRQLRPGA